MNSHPLIVLIDDDEIANLISKIVIDEAEVTDRVITANSGAEGLQKVQEFCEPISSNYHNIIFLDINMPGMNGFEFLDEFQKMEDINRFFKIFLLSSSNHKADYDRAEKYDLAGLIRKPLTKEKFVGVMKIINGEEDELYESH